MYVITNKKVICDHYVPARCDAMKCGHGGWHYFINQDDANTGGCDGSTMCECFEKPFPVKCIPIDQLTAAGREREE